MNWEKQEIGPFNYMHMYICMYNKDLDTTLYVISLEWCNILCHEDNKKHLVNSLHLESEIGDYVTKDDLKRGSTVVWNYRGVPYTADILGSFGKLCGIIPLQMCILHLQIKKLFRGI